MLFGVLLPFATLLFELLTHACAETLFDPIPTWWHVVLIALVPLVNAATLVAVKQGRTTWLWPLGHGNAAAMAIAFWYAVPFGPITPIAVVGILYLGLGLLALSPLLAFFLTWTARGALRRAAPVRGTLPRLFRLPRFWPGFAAGSLAVLLPFAHQWFTDEVLRVAMSKDELQSRRAVQLLRWAGSRRTLLDACYGRNAWGSSWGNLFMTRGFLSRSDTQAQEVFYRVTGTPHNSVPAPASATISRRGRGMWNWDESLGGTKVANKVAGLSMNSSWLDGKVDAAAGTSYVEWTMVFKNIAANQSEARAQIELPPGGVVSRLTLRIDGEPREAAFGARAQVRAAYQEVAVQQRRDPVLVTTSGPGRILMQCFPVPPNGGEMKVRVGVTAPLRLLGAREGEVVLPRMIEANFEQAEGFAHDLWIESSEPLNGGGTTVKLQLSEQALRDAQRIVTALPQSAGEQWTADPADPQFAIRQTVRRVRPEAPARAVFVIDGSKSMAAELRGIAEALRKVPAGLELAVIFAGDEPEVFAMGRDSAAAAAWLKTRRAKGGRDNLPAIERAWDLAAEQAGSAVVWLHGPQPVLLSTAERLLQRTERERTPPVLYDLAAGAAPNRVIEQLDGFRGLRPMRLASALPENLTHLLARWRGEASEYEFVRERVARDTAPDDTAGTKHIARLWALGEIERLRAEPANLDRAIKLALQLQLVTPVSGAVVLERQEQYDRHGLDPADPNSVPTVPEPTTALLAALGAAALLVRRRRA